MVNNRFLTIIYPGIVLILFESIWLKPSLIYLAAFLGLLSIFYTIVSFIRESEIDKRWWNYLILPASFFTCSIAYITVVTSTFFVQFVITVNVLFYFFYLKNLYYFLIKPASYKKGALENISSYACFLAVFFGAGALYGFQVFLNLPIWILILIILPMIALILYHVFFINKIEFNVSILYVLIGCIIMIELAWSLTFLPFSYHVTALVLAICYYMMIGLTRFYLKDGLKKRTVRLYLLFGFSSILLILITS